MQEYINIFITAQTLLLVNVLVSVGLFVLIWLIQLMHYPTFRFIDPSQWTNFHKHHTRSISFVVMPLMLLELGIAILLFVTELGIMEGINLGLVIALWLITFLSAIPLHNALSTSKNTDTIERLIKMNWWRTGLWTVKFLLALYMFYGV